MYCMCMCVARVIDIGVPVGWSRGHYSCIYIHIGNGACYVWRIYYASVFQYSTSDVVVELMFICIINANETTLCLSTNVKSKYETTFSVFVQCCINRLWPLDPSEYVCKYCGSSDDFM